MTPSVEVWKVDLRHPADVSVLSLEEATRADRYRCGFVRERFQRARAALRRLLGQRLSLLPQDVRFRMNPFGKPELVGPCQFNVSHSADFALIGVGDQPLGIDIEECRDGLDYDGLSRRYFTVAEADVIADAAGADKQHAFFRIWTRKEAVVKAAGSGLTIPLESFDCSDLTVSRLEVQLPGDACRTQLWSVHDCILVPGYFAAVALNPDIANIEFREYHPSFSN